MSDASFGSYSIHEVAEMLGLENGAVSVFLLQEWVRPVKSDLLDQEDIARIQLILELRDQLGVNDESIPVILHLTDQIYFLRRQIRAQSRES